MKRKILKIVTITIVMTMLVIANVFAATLDPTIPTFDSSTMTLSSDGTAKFVPPTYSGKWKRFDIQLLKRVSSITSTSGTNTVVYSYKDSGSVKYISADENEYSFNISSVGYYQFKIRGENLEGNYGAWAYMVPESAWATYEGVAVTEDDISVSVGTGGSGSGIGSGYDINYGPGIAQTGMLPQGYQYAVIGPNGQIMSYFGGNQSNYYQTPQQYQGNSAYYGPGYTNNSAAGNSAIYPYTGISGYPVVTAPNVGGVSGGATINNQNSMTNPNMYSGGTTQGVTNPNTNVNSSVMPQVTQGLEIGWHVDNNGRFYYQGNGVVLKGTWYFIDGYYYRFGDNGYVLSNQWFKDNSTGYWYYLSGDGRMLTGWQNINGVWYYFKPQNGNGYGTMYANTSLQITDAVYGTGYYAFDSNGAMVRNAWYGGYYYGSDGNRTN